MSEWISAERQRLWPPLALRIVIGAGFIMHGQAKLTRGPDGFAHLLDQAGVPIPEPTAWAVTLLELIGGVAILIGAFVAVVSVPLIVTMVGAIVTVNLRYGFSSVNTIGLTPDGPVFSPPGYEVNLLYIAGLIALIVAGPSAYSIDRSLKNRSRPSTPDHAARVGRPSR